jgi:DNA repair protein RadC
MTIIDVSLLFAAALKCLASCIVISHNHPSGNTTPSNEDINITNKIKKGGELLDIKVLDHIILAPNGNYYSFAEWAKI